MDTLEKPHVLNVDVGGGAVMCAPFDLEWHLRYGDPMRVRMLAASAISSYDYLIRECTKEEAWRRIKIMRTALESRT